MDAAAAHAALLCRLVASEALPAEHIDLWGQLPPESLASPDLFLGTVTSLCSTIVLETPVGPELDGPLLSKFPVLDALILEEGGPAHHFHRSMMEKLQDMQMFFHHGFERVVVQELIMQMGGGSPKAANAGGMSTTKARANSAAAATQSEQIPVLPVPSLFADRVRSMSSERDLDDPAFQIALQQKLSTPVAGVSIVHEDGERSQAVPRKDTFSTNTCYESDCEPPRSIDGERSQAVPPSVASREKRKARMSLQRTDSKESSNHPTPEPLRSPSSMTHRPSVTSRISASKSMATELEQAPPHAFVINIRRLIEVKEFLSLIHELLKSTAIAAITLVAAESQHQFQTTLLFISSVFILYSFHQTDWDRLDVEDINMLLPLLCDDNDPNDVIENPNRLFKAVTTTNGRLWKRIQSLFQVALAAVAVLGWMTLEYYWRTKHGTSQSNTQVGRSRFLEWWRDSLIVDQEDAIVVGTQLFVGTLMYILQVVFEFILWRETLSVMPLTASGEPWDPRQHGIPFRFWLFGLPSMWFTQQSSLDKLKEFIALATPGKELTKDIYPQELAYYALTGDQQREELQTALGEAKLFDADRDTMVVDEDGMPKPLDIDLCFFDSERQHKAYKNRGEFTYFVMKGEPGISPRTTNMTVMRTHSRKSASATGKSSVATGLSRMLSRLGRSLTRSRSHVASDAQEQ